MAALGPDEVLREEAAAIHGKEAAKKVGDKAGDALYRALHGLNSVALCLSGGGIRSASFALGVIEALAVHPRPRQISRRTTNPDPCCANSTICRRCRAAAISEA